MPNQKNTITESYNTEEITPNYGAITGMQFGLGAVSAFTSGTIGAAVNGAATTSLTTALSSGTSTITGQVTSTLISNAVANQTTDLLIDLFNCKSNDGCKIAAAILGGAVGGLAGWKVGDLIDTNILGADVQTNTFVDTIKELNMGQKLIDIMAEYPLHTSIVVNSFTNPIDLINISDKGKIVSGSDVIINTPISPSLSAKNIYVE